jgi:hypothetical protein
MFLRIKRFGVGKKTFYFPDASTFSDNFSNLVPSTKRLPGMDGGFDEYGVDVAPSEIGKVEIGLWLIASTPAEMTRLTDKANEMADWGVQKLFIQPYNTDLIERWCNARINNISMSENADKSPERGMRVQMTFQVADPYWYTLGTESPLYGDANSIYGAFGLVYGGSAVSPIVCNGLLTEAIVTAGGNATTLARITVTVPAGKTAENIRIQRLENGVVRDEVKYIGVLTPSDTLLINGRDTSIKLNNLDAYTQSFSFLDPDWMRIKPGENTIRVLMDGVANGANVKIQFYERYR